MNITQAQARELFDYNPDTGALVWRSARRGVTVGSVAGVINASGYRQAGVNRRIVLVHRLVWLLVYGELPAEIDHINGDRADNRISNLRSATGGQNKQNRRMLKRNTSGLKGVFFHKGMGLWHAQVNANGKPVARRFRTIFDAAAWVIPTRERLHGEFANRGNYLSTQYLPTLTPDQVDAAIKLMPGDPT